MGFCYFELFVFKIFNCYEYVVEERERERERERDLLTLGGII